MKHLNKSPLGFDLTDYITVKDYSVSKEDFQVKIDEESGMMVTTPQPLEKDLGLYYLSPDYISHTDSNKTFFDKIYQFIKKYSLKKKLNLINSFVNKKEKTYILDVGCGTGDFLKVCQDNNWNIKGVEPGDKASKLAIQKIGNNVISSLSSDTLAPKSFDVITLWHVLEHIPNLDESITRIKDILKTDGTLVVAVPNPNSYDSLHYREYWAAYDVPRHLYHFTQKSIEMLFEKYEMKVIDTKPMVFDSFYVSLLSEQHKHGKKNWLSAFLIGLESNIKASKSGEYSSLIYIIKNK